MVVSWWKGWELVHSPQADSLNTPNPRLKAWRISWELLISIDNKSSKKVILISNQQQQQGWMDSPRKMKAKLPKKKNVCKYIFIHVYNIDVAYWVHLALLVCAYVWDWPLGIRQRPATRRSCPQSDWVLLHQLRQTWQSPTDRPKGQNRINNPPSSLSSQVIIGCGRLTIKTNHTVIQTFLWWKTDQWRKLQKL